MAGVETWNEAVIRLLTALLAEGGGGGAEVTATAAAPSYVEGSEGNPLSSDLFGGLRSLLVSPAGASIDLSGAATGTPAQVASSATAVIILAANTARKGASIVNDSTAILYLILSTTTPTASIYTVALDPKGAVGSYYEVPFGYTGIIKGIWASANGNAVVTEFT